MTQGFGGAEQQTHFGAINAGLGDSVAQESFSCMKTGRDNSVDVDTCATIRQTLSVLSVLLQSSDTDNKLEVFILQLMIFS